MVRSIKYADIKLTTVINTVHNMILNCDLFFVYLNPRNRISPKRNILKYIPYFPRKCKSIARVRLEAKIPNKMSEIFVRRFTWFLSFIFNFIFMYWCFKFPLYHNIFYIFCRLHMGKHRFCLLFLH